MIWITARGEPLDFEQHKYLVDIYKDQFPNIVFQKAAQMGLSERLISEAVWVCDRLKKNVLFVFPSANQLNDFVQARLEPVFNQSDYLSRITGALTVEERKEKNVENKKKIQKVGLKQIGSGFLYLRGSQNQQQIITVDADMVCMDERDRFNQDLVPYIDKRLLHSTLKWRREVSTPTYPGKGINASYLKSDQRVWMLTCSSCELEQELDFFFNVNFEKKQTICKKCKKIIDRLKKGHWVAQNPTSKIHGYKISGIYNSRYTIKELVEMFEKAENSGFSARQQFYNQVLGLPYEATGVSLSLTDLDNCTQNYTTPFEVTDCFGGADVGAKINVAIAKKVNDKSRLVWIGTVNDFFGPVGSLEALIIKYNIQMMVVDAAPENRKVRELIEKFPNRIFAAYYPNRRFDIQNYYVFDEFKSEVSIDKTISLDYLISDIQNGRIELPSNSKYIPEFYEQMMSSVRVTETNPRTGQPQTRWVEKGPDHYLHACLTANTKIQTLKGIVSISKIKVGDYVLTREGFKRVNDTYRTQKNAKVMKVTFSNGKELVGTPDHRIWLQNKGFVFLHSVNYGDIILSCNFQKLLFFKVLHIGAIQIQKIGQIGYILLQMVLQEIKDVKDIIKNYGNLFMERFLMGMLFITKMVTPSIMISPTSNVFLGGNINRDMLKKHLKIQNIERRIGNTWIKSENYLMNGEKQKKEKRGILSTLLKVLFYRPLKNLFVSNVVVKVKRLVFRAANFVRQDVAIVSIQENFGREDVYNLTVEECHEYYANGVLVANCNYMRMASLKGAVGQALMESYKKPKEFAPTSLGSWANLVRTKGIRFS